MWTSLHAIKALWTLTHSFCSRNGPFSLDKLPPFFLCELKFVFGEPFKPPLRHQLNQPARRHIADFCDKFFVLDVATLLATCSLCHSGVMCVAVVHPVKRSGGKRNPNFGFSNTNVSRCFVEETQWIKFVNWLVQWMNATKKLLNLQQEGRVKHLVSFLALQQEVNVRSVKRLTCPRTNEETRTILRSNERLRTNVRYIWNIFFLKIIVIQIVSKSIHHRIT